MAILILKTYFTNMSKGWVGAGSMIMVFPVPKTSLRKNRVNSILDLGVLALVSTHWLLGKGINDQSPASILSNLIKFLSIGVRTDVLLMFLPLQIRAKG